MPQGNKFSYWHACVMVAGVWSYALVFAVGPLSGWGQYGAEPYGTACCIDWNRPSQSSVAMSYIICLFFFCYVVPCTVIFLSYYFILMTVRGSRQAMQQHMSPQNKISNTQTLIVKLSVAVCIGFLSAWTPYAIVSMWAAFGQPENVPPMAFALAAMFAKSSTLYNPIVYLAFKPNFRRSLCGGVAQFRGTLCACLCRPDTVRNGEQLQLKVDHDSTRLYNGLSEIQGSCRPRPQTDPLDDTPQTTARMLTGSLVNKVTVSQLSNEAQSDFL
ncbi:hypothetical protein NHX12_012654 [Muraenolepis orangiensis]|uniref:G-protein coupled receptors family 1 profile domain-containing protein n=1 Tax=Muraenolepis orangiensis TaxID=630683 RepID=A0A9Q0I536_9TELE|nr:hypothetical protein NHX12_012654 [Muraenolepis orangiensis]